MKRIICYLFGHQFVRDERNMWSVCRRCGRLHFNRKEITIAWDTRKGSGKFVSMGLTYSARHETKEEGGK